MRSTPASLSTERAAARHDQAVLITCEHGGNHVPGRYRRLFQGCGQLLQGHRGFDRGALALAADCARRLDARLLAATTTRLLVDLNRKDKNRAFSALTRSLADDERDRILRVYHAPYRRSAEDWIRRQIRSGRSVLHISCHSFTPVLNGTVRLADIGLLYDPKRAPEARFCAAWRSAIRTCMQRLRVRMNYPYKGTSDGLTSYLRTRFDATRYLGIEIEVNQSFPAGCASDWRSLRRLLSESLARVAKPDAAQSDARTAPRAARSKARRRITARSSPGRLGSARPHRPSRH